MRFLEKVVEIFQVSLNQLVKEAETIRDMKGDGSHADVMLQFGARPEKLVYKIKLKSSLPRGKHR